MAGYRIRRVANGKRRDGTPYVAYTLTVPPDIARRLAAELEFRCELTDEGILYRPVDRPQASPLPAWAGEEWKQAFAQ